jgi:hypothetical protein
MSQVYYHRVPLDTTGLALVPFNLELPRVILNKTGIRLLIVVDRPSRACLANGKLGESNPGNTLNNVIMAAARDSEGTLGEFMVVNYIDATVRAADDSPIVFAKFSKRIADIASRYKPDIIVSLGRTFNYALNWLDRKENLLNIGRIRTGNILGIEYQCIESFPWLDWAGGPPDNPIIWSSVNLISLVVSHFSLAIAGANRYTLPQAPPNVHMIATMEQWKVFYRLLCNAPEPSIDTEGLNLNRIANGLLTAQFCFNGKDCLYCRGNIANRRGQKMI